MAAFFYMLCRETSMMNQAHCIDMNINLKYNYKLIIGHSEKSNSNKTRKLCLYFMLRCSPQQIINKKQSSFCSTNFFKVIYCSILIPIFYYTSLIQSYAKRNQKAFLMACLWLWIFCRNALQVTGVFFSQLHILTPTSKPRTLRGRNYININLLQKGNWRIMVE